jgi:hypothetical protein
MVVELPMTMAMMMRLSHVFFMGLCEGLETFLTLQVCEKMLQLHFPC